MTACTLADHAHTHLHKSFQNKINTLANNREYFDCVGRCDYLLVPLCRAIVLESLESKEAGALLNRVTALHKNQLLVSGCSLNGTSLLDSSQFILRISKNPVDGGRASQEIRLLLLALNSDYRTTIKMLAKQHAGLSSGVLATRFIEEEKELLVLGWPISLRLGCCLSRSPTFNKQISTLASQELGSCDKCLVKMGLYFGLPKKERKEALSKLVEASSDYLNEVDTLIGSRELDAAARANLLVKIAMCSHLLGEDDACDELLKCVKRRIEFTGQRNVCRLSFQIDHAIWMSRDSSKSGVKEQLALGYSVAQMNPGGYCHELSKLLAMRGRLEVANEFSRWYANQEACCPDHIEQVLGNTLWAGFGLGLQGVEWGPRDDKRSRNLKNEESAMYIAGYLLGLREWQRWSVR